MMPQAPQLASPTRCSISSAALPHPRPWRANLSPPANQCGKVATSFLTLQHNTQQRDSPDLISVLWVCLAGAEGCSLRKRTGGDSGRSSDFFYVCRDSVSTQKIYINTLTQIKTQHVRGQIIRQMWDCVFQVYLSQINKCPHSIYLINQDLELEDHRIPADHVPSWKNKWSPLSLVALLANTSQ